MLLSGTLSSAHEREKLGSSEEVLRTLPKHPLIVASKHGELTFAVASSEPLTSNGGPLRSGQQLLTKLSCSLIFFTYARNSEA